MAGQPKHKYELTAPEQAQVDRIVERIEQDGGLYKLDRDGEVVYGEGNRPIPLEFQVLRGKRWCVTPDGRVWKFGARGTQKAEGVAGAPFRHNAVTMWTGHWMRERDGGTKEEPKYKYKKHLVWIAVDKGVNEVAGITHMDYYLGTKGYKHPFDAPHAPSAAQLRALGAKEHEAAGAIYALAEEQAIEMGTTADALLNTTPDKPKKNGRTNKKTADVA